MTEFWTAVLALTIFLYVTLDGFDLGIGILMPLARNEAQRDSMLATIAPVWDGNETWLVLNATILYGIFPLTFSVLLSAFYLPLMFMLAGLIFRGVAFEFRESSEKARRFWDNGFMAGSYVATLVQGTAVGALVRGLPMDGDRYVGGAFGWLSPFALLCGVGLCIGYALMGAAWLTYKSQPDIRDLGFRLMPRLLIALFAFLAAIFGLSLADELWVLRRWIETPELLAFPTFGLLACALMLWATQRRWELLPLFCSVGVFAAAMGTLSVSFYPYMIPFAITTAHAAAPASTQLFMFWGVGVFVLPLTLVYTLVVYIVFKGKVGVGQHGY
jgi:cytochrome bd ubiquinol oxidase subunit II